MVAVVFYVLRLTPSARTPRARTWPDIRPAYRQSAREIRALRTMLQRFEIELDSACALESQIAMERRSKLVSTLSNVMKKMTDRSASIIQNLK